MADQISISERPPVQSRNWIAWARRNLFATPLDILLTLIAVAAAFWIIPHLYGFFIGNAVFSDPEGLKGAACRIENVGACWIYIADRFDFFIFGFYPRDQYWRPILVFALTAILLIPLLWPRAPFKRTNAVLFFVVMPVVAYYLLNGGVFGLPVVTTRSGAD